MTLFLLTVKACAACSRHRRARRGPVAGPNFYSPGFGRTYAKLDAWAQTRVLRYGKIGLKADAGPKLEPTLKRVIKTLEAGDLAWSAHCRGSFMAPSRIALVDFLTSAGAHVSTVAPYVYADEL